MGWYMVLIRVWCCIHIISFSRFLQHPWTRIKKRKIWNSHYLTTDQNFILFIWKELRNVLSISLFRFSLFSMKALDIFTFIVNTVHSCVRVLDRVLWFVTPSIELRYLYNYLSRNNRSKDHKLANSEVLVRFQIWVSEFNSDARLLWRTNVIITPVFDLFLVIFNCHLS